MKNKYIWNYISAWAYIAYFVLSPSFALLWRFSILKTRLDQPPFGRCSPFFFSFIFISWRLITLQYCSGFCHTLTWISHGFTCIPHPDPPSYLPLHPIPLGLPSAPGPSTCLIHPAQGPFYWHWDSRMGHCPMSFLLPQLGNRGEKKKKYYESVGRQFPMDLLGFCKIHRQN